MRDCQQFKCDFRSRDGCPPCPECRAPPHKVASDDLCVSCHSCEGDEGVVRGTGQNQIGQGQRQRIIQIIGDVNGTGQNTPKD